MANAKVNRQFIRYNESTIEQWLVDVLHHALDIGEDDFLSGLSIVCGDRELSLPFCPETWDVIETALTEAVKGDVWEDYR